MSSGFQALCLNTNRSELSGSCFVLFTYLFDVLSLMCIFKFPISCSTPCSKSACLMGLLFNRIAHAVAHASTLFLCRPETGAELLEMDSYLALILGVIKKSSISKTSPMQKSIPAMEKNFSNFRPLQQHPMKFARLLPKPQFPPKLYRVCRIL